jgi:predicted aspartyl protease
LTSCANQTAVCKVQKEAILPVSFAKDGRPLVDVQIDGKTEHMILDTGSVVTILTPAAARALDLKNLTPSPLTILGVGGEQKDLPSAYLNIGLGGWSIMHTLIMVNNPVPRLGPNSDGIDGAIGINMLKPFDVDLDLPDAQISLYLPQNCILNVSLPPWPQPYGATDFFERPDGESMTLIQLNRRILPAVVDTGSQATVIPSSMLKWAGIVPEKTINLAGLKAVGYGPGIVKITGEQFDYLRIGAETTAKPWLAVADGNFRLQEALIGDNYLRHHRVFMANSTEMIYFGLYAAEQK